MRAEEGGCNIVGYCCSTGKGHFLEGFHKGAQFKPKLDTLDKIPYNNICWF